MWRWRGRGGDGGEGGEEVLPPSKLGSSFFFAYPTSTLVVQYTTWLRPPRGEKSGFLSLSEPRIVWKGPIKILLRREPGGLPGVGGVGQ